MTLDDLWSGFNTFNTEKGMSARSPIDANTITTMSIHFCLALGRPFPIKLGGWIFLEN